MYYDLSKALSYGAFINFLVGERGCGKTYSATKFVTKKFIEKGSQFVYIRRYKTDLQKSLPQFFDAVKKNEKIFQDHTFETKGNKLYIDGSLAGYGVTLSTAQDYKSANFTNVKYIIYDEFIIEEGNKHYIKNEIDHFLGLIESVARMRDVVILCLGNASKLLNPYFIYFDLSLPYGNDIKTYKDGLILVQYMKNEAYREAKKETKFGRLVEGTEYSNYAIENQFKENDKNFIMHKTKNAKCNLNFLYNDFILGVWYDYNEGKIFISSDYDLHSQTFACTTNDHQPNTMLLTAVKDYSVIKQLLKNYKLGNVFYESVKVKSVFKDIISKFV